MKVSHWEANTTPFRTYSKMFMIRPASKPPRNTRAKLIFPIGILHERSPEFRNSKGAEGTVGWSLRGGHGTSQGERQGRDRGEARRGEQGRGEREEGAMFRLLPGISDIVPLRKNPKTGGYERAARGAVLRRRARALRLLGRLSFAKCFMALRSSQLAFVWYPGPSALSQAMTSESRRMVTGRFAGRWNFPISAALQSRTGGASEKSMSLSLFAAIARTSRFCAFVSFLIGFPFMGRGGTSRND